MNLIKRVLAIATFALLTLTGCSSINTPSADGITLFEGQFPGNNSNRIFHCKHTAGQDT